MKRGALSVRQAARNTVLILALCAIGLPASGAFSPPRNLDPQSATIRLDSSFQSDAWLVYTYDIGETGNVVNATIQSSNGVPEVEQAILAQVKAMRFEPAMSNGRPVKVSADPVTYTWILDRERQLSAGFDEMYRRAWALFSENNYEAASGIAEELQSYAGRNAMEEVKAQVLAASLASRQQDETAELRHLARIVELQNLALSNNFKHTYVPREQYLKMLDRIVTLQLDGMMLADAGVTLQQLQALGQGTEVATAAADRCRQAEQAFSSMSELTVLGELVPLFQGGSGSWETGLSRNDFSISDVHGRIGAVYLVCSAGEQQLRYPPGGPWQVPPGWTDCKIDLTGQAGTRFVLHQLMRGSVLP
jgi:TonB family protein